MGFRLSPSILAPCLCFLVFLSLLPLQASALPAEAVPGEFIVKFRQTSSQATRAQLRSRLGVRRIHTNISSGSELVRLRKNRIFKDHYAKELLAEGLVEYIEPNYIVKALRTPNDPLFPRLWGMHNSGQNGGTADADIDAPEAWGITSGGADVVVAVLDTGVDISHPDLSANIWKNPKEIPGNGIDDDLNGVIDDVYGYNAILGNGDVTDENGHGTHCAGTIAAVGNNSLGVTGVSWKAKILPLKFLDDRGSGTVQDAIKAIEYAIDLKNSGVNIRVLSNSWGGGGFSQALADAISATKRAGILFVAAAGNESSDSDQIASYPASYNVENILSVAAIDRNGNLAWFSNFGASSVDLAAPGADILSTSPGGGYQEMSGTSMAAPHVSGIAALLSSKEPALDGIALRKRIVGTVKPLSQLAGLLRYPGLASALNSLTNARSHLPPPPPSVGYSFQAASLSEKTPYGQLILSVDDGYSEVTLPFSFPFYGKQFSRLAVSANGRVIPLGEGQKVPESFDYSNSLSTGILPYHDDLIPSPFSPEEAGVWLNYSADAAVLTWVSASYAHRGSTDEQAEIRFQLSIDKSGELGFIYLDTFSGDPSYDYAKSASIGIAPVPGTSGKRLSISENSAAEHYTASGRSLVIREKNTRFTSDFDGDLKSDIVVWRPAEGMWYVLYSGSDFDPSKQQQFQLGLPGDIPKIGDFDGDKKADFAVWRPSNGTWYFRTSKSNYQIISSVQWGLPGDLPLVGDYDGDSLSDLGVYRASTGAFHVLLSSHGYDRLGALSGSTPSVLSVSLGGPGNDPVIGDFTGDGKDDFAVIWQLHRFWSVKDAATSALLWSTPWGEQGDTPLACDLDADGLSDRLVVRVNSGYMLDWFAAMADGSVRVETFGSLGDSPDCTRDYDGDGKADLRLFRNGTGEWFIKNSASSQITALQFGLPGDIPL